MRRIVLLGAAVVSLIPAIASAVVTPFATFQAVAGTSYNVGYNSANTTLFTTPSGTTTTPGAPGGVAVNFDYLQDDPTLNAIGIQRALFTLSTRSSGAGSRNDATEVDSQGQFGSALAPSSFSFTSLNAFTVNGITYNAGTNLLSGTFSNGSLAAEDGGTSGSFFASTPGSQAFPRQVQYTSAFLDFSNTTNRSFSFNLDAISPRAGVANGSFDSFSAIVGGTLSSDPAPLVIATTVAEPAAWMTMIGGFGLIGWLLRRRRSSNRCLGHA